MTEAQGVILLAQSVDMLEAVRMCFAALCAVLGVGLALVVSVTWKG